MKKRKSMKSLLSARRIVYVRLENEREAEAFLALARYEGFTLSDEVERTGARGHCFVRLNQDMTVSYPAYRSWAGAMRFFLSTTENGKRVVKLDFAKLL